MKQNLCSRLPFLYLLAIFATLPACGFAQVTDTPEARRLAVRRYLQLVPMKSVWEESIQEVAKNVPANQRPTFVAITRQTDLSRLETAAAESLARHLTLKEIQAFIAFMELPEGQSAMKKMKFYMADLMPVLQSELTRAAEKAAK
jgi:hypothetical protein